MQGKQFSNVEWQCETSTFRRLWKFLASRCLVRLQAQRDLREKDPSINTAPNTNIELNKPWP